MVESTMTGRVKTRPEELWQSMGSWEIGWRDGRVGRHRRHRRIEAMRAEGTEGWGDRSLARRFGWQRRIEVE
ncbi:hypothetical protein HAX54_010208 [Datura stramonium]|uniref:Uncharacterized protein n=1 Tax=Datura stramonium TaxID=4076 RepID=A0ABS8TFZ9_DATST|nr:hypothetical protein [Datura stramonium]